MNPITRLKSSLPAMMLTGCLAFSYTAQAQTTPPPSTGDTTADKRLSTYTGQAPATRDYSDDMDDFIHSTRQPAPWFKWGADFRFRETYLNNVTSYDGTTPNHERRWEQYRARWWGTASPLDNLDLNLRMTWEGRYYDTPKTFDHWYGGTILIDNLNVHLKKIGELPLSVKVGRQDIVLGEGWLICDGTPLDAGRTIYFDAARLTLDLASIQSSLEMIYIDQGGADDRWLHPINDLEEDQIEQNERAAILYFTNKSLKNTQFDAYFIYKHDDAVGTGLRRANGSYFPSGGDTGENYTVGGRMAFDLTENWKYRLETAGQFGHRMGQQVNAMGLNSRLAYHFNDDMNNQLRLNYEYLSGDNPGTTGTNEAFNPLWGRWPQFSELYIYSYAVETRIAETTNLHRVGLNWSIKPTKQIDLIAGYDLLLADQNTLRGNTAAFSHDGWVRGHLVSAILKYRHNEHIAGHVWTEFLFPGNYYAATRDEMATFLRVELQLTW